MSQPSTATDVLREEHRLILVVLEVLERLLAREDGGEPPLEDLADCLKFFRFFADACHHGKEEDLLFPELEERGMPRDQGPIAVMLEEHRMGRSYVKEMSEALEGMREGNGEAWPRIQRTGVDYIELMRGHIGKEDGVLFQMADQLVEGPACARLCGQYEEVCSRRFNGQTKTELERLAHSLEERVPPWKPDH